MATNSLTQFIHDYVRLRSITINDLAKVMNVPHSTVARWASGKTEPSLKQLAKLADATNTDICYLVRLIYPQPDASIEPNISRLAEQISHLPIPAQELMDSIILGLSLKGHKQDTDVS